MVIKKRELVHIEDFVKTLLFLVETKENQIINIGSGFEYSIREFAMKICEIIGYNFSNIIFDIKKHVGAKSKVLRIDKLLSILPTYSPKELEKGLEETVSWFIKNRNYF